MKAPWLLRFCASAWTEALGDHGSFCSPGFCVHQWGVQPPEYSTIRKQAHLVSLGRVSLSGSYSRGQELRYDSKYPCLGRKFKKRAFRKCHSGRPAAAPNADTSCAQCSSLLTSLGKGWTGLRYLGLCYPPGVGPSLAVPHCLSLLRNGSCHTNYINLKAQRRRSRWNWRADIK